MKFNVFNVSSKQKKTFSCDFQANKICDQRTKYFDVNTPNLYSAGRYYQLAYTLSMVKDWMKNFITLVFNKEKWYGKIYMSTVI